MRAPNLVKGCGLIRVAWVCLVFVLPLSASADVLTGKVVKVVDGDTIYVLDDDKVQHKIRLAGIDAPERSQAYGNASRKHLASLVAGKPVKIEYEKYDRYGRIVGKVFVGQVDVCLRTGYAWHYKKYQHEQSPEDRVLYAEAEDSAREWKLGLWRENNPMPPWEFRRLHRSQ
jgi:endonuclease YncB( thermonuclease family)